MNFSQGEQPVEFETSLAAVIMLGVTGNITHMLIGSGASMLQAISFDK